MENKNRFLEVLVFLIPALISLIISLSLVTFLDIQKQDYYFTADEASFDLFSKKIIDNQLPSYSIELNDVYKTTAFSPYYVALVGGRNILPDHLGFVLQIVNLRKFIPLKILNPIFFVLSTLLFSLILSNLTKKRWVIFFGGLLFSFSNIFWHYSQLLFSDMFFLLNFLIMLFLIVKYEKSGEKKFLYFLITDLFIISIIRYINLLLFLPIILFVIYSIIKTDFKKIFLIILIGLLIFFPILLLNFNSTHKIFVYPSYENSKSILYGVSYPEANTSKIGIPGSSSQYRPISLNITSVPKNLFFYLALFPSILYFFLIPFLNKNANTKKNIIYLFLILSLFIYTIFYLSISNTFTVGSLSPHNSMARYLIPIFSIILIIIILGISLCLKNLNKKIKVIIITLVLLVFIINQVSIMQTANLGLISIKEKMLNYGEIREGVLSNTPQGSIVITSVWEKIVYPDRYVFVYSRIPENIRLTETERILKELIKNEERVFILKTPTESEYYDITSKRAITFNDLFKKIDENFSVQLVVKNDKYELFEIK